MIARGMMTVRWFPTTEVLAREIRVTKQEREEHERTHIPYRSWCDIFVRARGRKCAHSRKVHSREEDVHEEVPWVSLDY